MDSILPVRRKISSVSHFELRGGADHLSCTVRSFRRGECFFTFIDYDYMPKLTLTALLTGVQGSRLHGNRLFHLDTCSNCTNALLRWKFKELLARNTSMAVMFETITLGCSKHLSTAWVFPCLTWFACVFSWSFYHNLFNLSLLQ